MKKQHFQTIHFFIGLTVTLLLFYPQTMYSQAKWFPTGSAAGKYKMGVDSSLQHEKQNAMTIKFIDAEIEGFGTLMQSIKSEKYMGKRIRMTGYMKSNEVTGWAGFWLRVDQAGSQQFLSFDNMEERAIKGTTDWKQYDVVLDVPTEASNIAFGALLNGTGQIWFDNLNFEIVDNSVPTTTGQKKYD